MKILYSYIGSLHMRALLQCLKAATIVRLGHDSDALLTMIASSHLVACACHGLTVSHSGVLGMRMASCKIAFFRDGSTTLWLDLGGEC